MGIDRQMSVRKATKSALERVSALEESIPQIIQGINSAFGQMENKVDSFANVLEAVKNLLEDVVGEGKVQAEVDSILLQRAVAASESQKRDLETAVKDGKFVVAAVVSEKSLIVGTEFDKDGKAYGAGRVQISLQGIKPEFKDKVSGQGVGFSFDLPNGGKFTINEIYDVAEQPVPAPAPAPEEKGFAPAPEAAPACSGDCSSCPGHVEPPAPPEKG